MEDKQEKVFYDDIDKVEIIEAYKKIYNGIKSGEITDEEIIELLPFKDSNTFISTTSQFLIGNPKCMKYYPVLMNRFYLMGLNDPKKVKEYFSGESITNSSKKSGRL